LFGSLYVDTGLVKAMNTLAERSIHLWI